jgi:hypothetical protein
MFLLAHCLIYSTNCSTSACFAVGSHISNVLSKFQYYMITTSVSVMGSEDDYVVVCVESLNARQCLYLELLQLWMYMYFLS